MKNTEILKRQDELIKMVDEILKDEREVIKEKDRLKKRLVLKIRKKDKKLIAKLTNKV